MSEETEALVEKLRLPRWNDIPDLELYMDQVLSLIVRYLGAYPGFDRKGLTASMVNNYVKLGVMPPPNKKKYAREHIAHLIMICVLKASLPIEALKNLLSALCEAGGAAAAYDAFCEDFECAILCAAKTAETGSVRGVCRAALRAQAEQAAARSLYDLSFNTP